MCLVSAVLILLAPAKSYAANINLELDKEGRVFNSANNQRIGELHRGWREDVLFVSLSTTNLVSTGENTSISVTSLEIDLDRLNPILYAVHGGSSELIASTSQNRTWLVSASEESSITIVAQSPHGVLSGNLLWAVFGFLGQIKDLWWLILSVVTPILTILMFILYRQRLKHLASKIPVSTLDQRLLKASPAALTVLWRGFVSRRATGATVIDLALRGHIQILVRDDALIIFRRESNTALRTHEQLMLEKWFGADQNAKIHLLAKSNGNEIVNRQSTIANLAIYDEVGTYQWFRTSPLLTHWQIITVSFILTIIFFMMFFSVFVFFPGASSLLWFLSGCLISVGLLFTWAPHYARLSATGSEAYRVMNGTRDLLAHPAPIHTSQENIDSWQDWLPLTLVLGITYQWMTRWSHYPFRQPDWFLTENPIRSYNQFLNLLEPVLKITSDSIREKILPAYV